jgi:hypothetical protein
VTIRALTLVVGLAILLACLQLLRRRRLKEKYAALWLVVAVGQLVLAAAPRLLDVVAARLGVADPPNLLAFAGLLFLLGVTAHLSWECSRLEEETRTLAEEVAMLRHLVGAPDGDRAAAPERAPSDDPARPGIP